MLSINIFYVINHSQSLTIPDPLKGSFRSLHETRRSFKGGHHYRRSKSSVNLVSGLKKNYQCYEHKNFIGGTARYEKYMKKSFLWKFGSRRRIPSRKVKAALVEEVNGVTHRQSENTPITKSEYKLFSEMCHLVPDVLRF